MVVMTEINELNIKAAQVINAIVDAHDWEKNKEFGFLKPCKLDPEIHGGLEKVMFSVYQANLILKHKPHTTFGKYPYFIVDMTWDVPYGEQTEYGFYIMKLIFQKGTWIFVYHDHCVKKKKEIENCKNKEVNE